MLHGWIKLHRSLLDNWVASEPDTLAVWIRMLAEANHKETKKRFNGSLVAINRGQLVFGLNAFSDKSGVSIAKLRRIISELESDGMINRQITSKYSIITITCFEKYQGDDSQITNESQAEHKQIASEQQHRKNVKNNKNVNNTNNGRFTPPSIEEIYSYMVEKGFDSHQEAERLFYFYDSKNWVVGKTKMKNWKSSVSRWILDKPKPKAQQKPQHNTSNMPTEMELIERYARGDI